MPRSMQIGSAIGMPIGLLLTVYLFQNVQWYHDFLVWQFTNPWIMVPAFLSGAAVAIIEDRD